MKYKTDDIILASYLSTVGAKLIEIEATAPNKGAFVFENVAQTIVDEFFIGKGRVDPIKYHNEYRSLITAVRHKLQRN